MTRRPAHRLAWLGLVLGLCALAVLGAQDPKPVTGVTVAAPQTGGTPVTDSSLILFDQASYLTVAGFTVAVDGGTPVEAGMAFHADLGGGAATFRIPVSSLSLANGAHTLTIRAYVVVVGDTVNSTTATINVVKS